MSEVFGDDDNVTYIRNGPIGPVPDPNQPNRHWRFFLAEICVLGGMILGLGAGVAIGYGLAEQGDLAYYGAIGFAFVTGMLAMSMAMFLMNRHIRKMINGDEKP